MSISHADFLRILPNAMRRVAPHHSVGSPCSLGNHGLRIVSTDGWLEIELGPEQSRVLASLTLPRTTVVFYFHDQCRQEAEAMMEQIDSVYRRGGG